MKSRRERLLVVLLAVLCIYAFTLKDSISQAITTLFFGEGVTIASADHEHQIMYGPEENNGWFANNTIFHYMKCSYPGCNARLTYEDITDTSSKIIEITKGNERDLSPHVDLIGDGFCAYCKRDMRANLYGHEHKGIFDVIGDYNGWFVDEKSHWLKCACGKVFHYKNETWEKLDTTLVEGESEHWGDSGKCAVCGYKLSTTSTELTVAPSPSTESTSTSTVAPTEKTYAVILHNNVRGGTAQFKGASSGKKGDKITIIAYPESGVILDDWDVIGTTKYTKKINQITITLEQEDVEVMPRFKFTQTIKPTSIPTSTPNTEPTSTPNTEPTSTPNTEPTSTPNTEPTSTPSTEPTSTPSTEPTLTPTLTSKVFAISISYPKDDIGREFVESFKHDPSKPFTYKFPYIINTDEYVYTFNKFEVKAELEIVPEESYEIENITEGNTEYVKITYYCMQDEYDVHIRAKYTKKSIVEHSVYEKAWMPNEFGHWNKCEKEDCKEFHNYEKHYVYVGNKKITFDDPDSKSQNAIKGMRCEVCRECKHEFVSGVCIHCEYTDGHKCETKSGKFRTDYEYTKDYHYLACKICGATVKSGPHTYKWFPRAFASDLKECATCTRELEKCEIVIENPKISETEIIDTINYSGEDKIYVGETIYCEVYSKVERGEREYIFKNWEITKADGTKEWPTGQPVGKWSEYNRLEYIVPDQTSITICAIYEGPEQDCAKGVHKAEEKYSSNKNTHYKVCKYCGLAVQDTIVDHREALNTNYKCDECDYEIKFTIYYGTNEYEKSYNEEVSFGINSWDKVRGLVREIKVINETTKEPVEYSYTEPDYDDPRTYRYIRFTMPASDVTIECVYQNDHKCTTIGDWEYNSQYHYKKCSGEFCGAEVDKASHSKDPYDGHCTVCQKPEGKEYVVRVEGYCDGQKIYSTEDNPYPYEEDKYEAGDIVKVECPKPKDILTSSGKTIKYEFVRWELESANLKDIAESPDNAVEFKMPNRQATLKAIFKVVE